MRRRIFEDEKVSRIIRERNLVGLANDTKWRELISSIGTHRFGLSIKTILQNSPDNNEIEFLFMPNFPWHILEWIDIGFIEQHPQGRLLPPKIINHSEYLENLLKVIGLEYRKNGEVIRVFGYGPIQEAT